MRRGEGPPLVARLGGDWYSEKSLNKLDWTSKFTTSEFFNSQYRNEEEKVEGTEKVGRLSLDS